MLLVFCLNSLYVLCFDKSVTMEFVNAQYIETIQAEDKEHDRAFLSVLISLEPELKVSLSVIEMLAGCLDMNIYVFVATVHAEGGHKTGPVTKQAGKKRFSCSSFFCHSAQHVGTAHTQ